MARKVFLGLLLAVIVLTPMTIAYGRKPAKFTRLVSSGDTIAGKVLRTVYYPSINNSGDVVFRGDFPVESGIFGLDRLYVASGDTIGGKLIEHVSYPAINDEGYLVFRGSCSGSTEGGIFTPTERLVFVGDTIDGKTLKEVVTKPAINDAGNLVFWARYFYYENGIYHSGAGIFDRQSFLLYGAGTIGGKYFSTIGGISINDNDPEDLVFSGVDVARNESSIFTPDTVLVASGDTIAGLTLSNAYSPSINDSGEPVFIGTFGGSGLFTRHGLLVRTIDAVDGKVVNTLVGCSINDSGDVVVSLGFRDNSNGIYLTNIHRPIADAGPDRALPWQDDCMGLTQVQLDGSESFVPDGTQLTYEWSAPENVLLDDPTSPTPSGLFPCGPSLLTLTVYGENGEVDCDDVLVTVQDTVPPVLVCTTDEIALWPPDHRMEEVMIYVVASDNCTDPGALELTCMVSSNEPDDAHGDGEFTGDVDTGGGGQDAFSAPVSVPLIFDEVTGIYWGSVRLRAERDGGETGRVYSVVCNVQDAQGNPNTASCVVVVPHDRRKN